MRLVIALFPVAFAASIQAAVPDEYEPIVVKAPFSFSQRLFDLTPAVERARAENKLLYVYLDAEDCPPCREYFHFLKQNQHVLREAFAPVLFVNIRTWLKGPQLVFKVNDERFSFAEFRERVGDKTSGALTYPYFWLLSPELKQVKQLPRGSRHYLDVDKQRKILGFPGKPPW
jgi:hypothetical protein